MIKKRLFRDTNPLILLALLIGGAVLCGAGAVLRAQEGQGNSHAGVAEYVGADKCLMCHSQMQAQWESNAHSATEQSVADPSLQSCEACHGPGSLHMQNQGITSLIKLPTAFNKLELSAICMKCHGDRDSVAPKTWKSLSPQGWRRTAHYRKDITCDKCHSVHGAAQADKLLRAEPGALCDTCHKKVSEGGAYTHTPVKQKKCSLCHDPHGAEQAPHMVRKNISGICESCHKPDTEESVKKHAGISPAGSRCIACHDPHANSAGDSLLRTQKHAPFKGGSCAVCHKGAGDPDPVALKKESKVLCVGCHAKTITEISEHSTAHFPAAESMCLSCHDPHTASRDALISDDFEVVCSTCHQGVAQQLSGLYPHPPVATGQCLSCHSPHGSQHEQLLTKEPDTLCKSCHSKIKFSHPMVEQDKSPDMDPVIRCYTCHSVHGGDIPKILPMAETSLCNKCHMKNNTAPLSPDAEE